MHQICPALQGLQDSPQGNIPGMKLAVGKVLYTFYHLAAFHCVKDLSQPITSAMTKTSQLAKIAFLACHCLVSDYGFINCQMRSTPQRQFCSIWTLQLPRAKIMKLILQYPAFYTITSLSVRKVTKSKMGYFPSFIQVYMQPGRQRQAGVL